jgi:hypothetical protein
VINAVPARQVGMVRHQQRHRVGREPAGDCGVGAVQLPPSTARSIDISMQRRRLPKCGAVDEERDSLAPPPLRTSISPEARDVVHSIVEKSWVDTTRLIMLAMAALALAGSSSAAILLRPIAAARKQRDRPSRR